LSTPLGLFGEVVEPGAVVSRTPEVEDAGDEQARARGAGPIVAGPV